MSLSKLKVVLVTGRSIEQGVSKERGKISDEYFQSVATCHMDPDDMKELGVKEGANVRVTTEFGSVVVKAVKSKRTPHKGTVFIPYGPWASIVVNPTTSSVGMPYFKGIPAEVEVAPKEEPILSLRELLRRHFGRG